MKSMLRIRSFVLICFVTLLSYADIAQPGLWQTIKLADSTEVVAELRGDEFVHYWQTANGVRYAVTDGSICIISKKQLDTRIAQRRAEFLKSEHKGKSRRLLGSPQHKAALKGNKRGIIILVDFKDKKFTMDNPQQYYTDMANMEGYDNGKQRGSVHDYFKDQSAGQFLVDFDIIGPVSMSEDYAYYGKDSEDGKKNDVNVGAMICNAINQASKYVNWKDYDWNEDNQVDQVYLIYAGGGQSSGGGADTVWPHKWSVSSLPQSGYSPMVVDGIVIDTYACSNEMRGTQVEGIGTICHEFSHCLGFPDMYDTSANDGETNINYGMGTWDLMCSGSHNQNGYCPPGYSSWEKMMAGWIEPTILTDNAIYDNIESQADNGEAFIVYNPANHNEYYMVENRQRKGWDRSIAGDGIMIIHVDYDKTIFERYNAPNTYIEGINDHQRLTIICADDIQSSLSESTDLYPYNNKDMLSNYTSPAATVYNTNLDGSKMLNIRISNIKQNADGSMGFVFGNRWRIDPDVFFAETFDNCTSTGANDNNWGTFRVATGEMRTDESGWTGSKLYGGFRCGRIGSNVETAVIETPTLTFTGNITLSFRAAPYTDEGTKTITVTSSIDNVILQSNTFQLETKQWIDFTTDITGTGNARLTFSGDCRFYLDEVVIRDNGSTGIINTNAIEQNEGIIFDLSGRKVSDTNRPGIYIRNGQKIIK